MPHAFWQTPFRVYFLLAALFAVSGISYWAMLLNGSIQYQGVLPPILWHAHEIIFGFGATVAVGFLLTAVQNWTGLKSISSRPLILASSAWLIARTAALLPYDSSESSLTSIPAILLISSQAIWWGLAIFYFSKVILLSKNVRNRIFIPILFIQAFMDIGMIIAALTNHYSEAIWLADCASLMFILLMSIIGGRVIPMFTRNTLKQHGATPAIKTDTWVESWIIPITSLTIATHLASAFLDTATASSALFIICAGMHSTRLLGWSPLSTLKHPLLWSLHLTYASMIVGMAIYAISLLTEAIRPADALHIITIAAMAGMILSMMSRVSLGHTGRPLHVTSIMSIAFLCLPLAALARVVLPLLQHTAWGYNISAFLWVAAFTIFVIRYSRVLISPRPDGKPG